MMARTLVIGFFVLVVLVMLLLTTSGCGFLVTHYACHRIDPVHGCDDPKDAK
jgi:hypothetical protein